MTTFTDSEKRNIARQMEKIGVFSPAIDQLTRIEAKLDAIVPAFLYLAAWLALTGIAFLAFGIETADRSITEIDEDLHTPAPAPAPNIRAASGAD